MEKKEELVKKLREVHLVGEGVSLGYYEDDGGGCIEEVVEILEEEIDRAYSEGYVKGVKECTEKLSKLTTK